MHTLWICRGKTFAILLVTVLVAMLLACSSGTGDATQTIAASKQPKQDDASATLGNDADLGISATNIGNAGTVEDGMIDITIAINNQVFAAKLHDNESARALIAQMPFTLNMDDYAAQEKVTELPFEMPAASTEKPDSINIGDIYLWSEKNLVLFYTTFSNSYSYVPIGRIVDATGLAEALGYGSVEVSFSPGDEHS